MGSRLHRSTIPLIGPYGIFSAATPTQHSAPFISPPADTARIVLVDCDVTNMSSEADNITWHSASVDAAARAQLNGHHGALLWYTGLSGAGKSTVANAVDLLLHRRAIHTYLLDGDNIRHGLNRNLGFSAEDRVENIRRIGEVGKLFVDAGLVVGSAFISPYRQDRDAIRALLPAGTFIEIFVDASLATCEARDPKSLYKQARAGEIKNFTGIDAPYEAPLSPELTLNSDENSVAVLAQSVVDFLAARGLLSLGAPR